MMTTAGNAAGIRSRSKHGAASQIFFALEARLKLTCALSQEEDGDRWSSSSAPELDDCDDAQRRSRYSILIETLQKTLCHGCEYVVAGHMALQAIEKDAAVR
jgi:hypothetical protein